MRILIVTTSASVGGAAVAARRLAEALAHEGAGVTMAVARDDFGAVAADADAPRVEVVVAGSRWRRRLAFLRERWRIFRANGFRRRGLWLVDIASTGVSITQTEAFRQADIVHLHWVNQGFISLAELRRIVASGKPVVWTLHDMWPVTAVCHHAGLCTAYESRCQSCPQLLGPGEHDLSARVFDAKLAIYSQARIHFVAVSEWMARRARRSALAAAHDVCVIPNALPMDIFRRTTPAEARRRLGIPPDAVVIAFGAARIDLPLKGFPRLCEALRRLIGRGHDAARLHLLLFGAVKDARALDDIPCAVTHVGTVTSADALADIYSAADVLANTSDFETFGQTLAEAMACGCPAVSFDRGGQTDIIRHLENGYLARYGDIDDLAAGLEWAVTTPHDADALRQSVATRFGSDAVAQRHLGLYEQLLTK